MTSIDDWIAAREVARCSVLHWDSFEEGVGIVFHLDSGRGIRAHFGVKLCMHMMVQESFQARPSSRSIRLCCSPCCSPSCSPGRRWSRRWPRWRRLGPWATRPPPSRLEIKMMYLALALHFFAFDMRTACNSKTSFRNFWHRRCSTSNHSSLRDVFVFFFFLSHWYSFCYRFRCGQPGRRLRLLLKKQDLPFLWIGVQSYLAIIVSGWFPLIKNGTDNICDEAQVTNKSHVLLLRSIVIHQSQKTLI